MSGTSIRISWNAVEDASSYTVDVQPAPTMTNELTVSSNYAFVDGLSVGQEYVIRVTASVHGVETPSSTEFKVTPSGAPLIAPAPRVMSFDESSVTLTRHRMRHYHNGNDMTKIFVRVSEEDGTAREMEFPVRSSYSFLLVLPSFEDHRSHHREELHLRLAFRQQQGCPADLLSLYRPRDSPGSHHS